MGSVLNMDRLRDEWVRRAPEVSYCNPDDPLLRQVMIRAVELVTGQPRLQRIYNDFNRACPEQDDFWVSAVEWLRLTVNYNAQQLDAIPSEDPLIVIANHPYGVVDGIAVSYLTSLVRKDIKLLAHATLGRAGALRPFLIPIEFEGDSSALRSNVESKRTAIRHLRDGGALVIFPAGQVSTAPRVFDQAVDAPWKLFAGKLVATSQATVVPVFFRGSEQLAVPSRQPVQHSPARSAAAAGTGQANRRRRHGPYRRADVFRRARRLERPSRIGRAFARYGLQPRSRSRPGAGDALSDRLKPRRRQLLRIGAIAARPRRPAASSLTEWPKRHGLAGVRHIDCASVSANFKAGYLWSLQGCKAFSARCGRP